MKALKGLVSVNKTDKPQEEEKDLLANYKPSEYMLKLKAEMATNKQAMAERGQKIDKMNDKAEIMAMNSQSLLETIKLYNEKQERGVMGEVQDDFDQIKKSAKKLGSKMSLKLSKLKNKMKKEKSSKTPGFGKDDESDNQSQISADNVSDNQSASDLGNSTYLDEAMDNNSQKSGEWAFPEPPTPNENEVNTTQNSTENINASPEKEEPENIDAFKHLYVLYLPLNHKAQYVEKENLKWC